MMGDGAMWERSDERPGLCAHLRTAQTGLHQDYKH